MAVSHILVPYDGTDKSDQAFEEALKLTKKYSCILSVVTCFHTSYVSLAYTTSIINEHIISSKMKKLEEKAKIENVSFSFHVINSPFVVTALLEYVDENNVDMIIMGSQKRQGIKRILRGSISEKIQKRAKCIVKII